VNELARALALIANRWLEAEPAELAHPLTLEDLRRRRFRHREHGCDLGASETQPPQRPDDLDTPRTGLTRLATRRRAAIAQTALSFIAVARHPLRTGLPGNPQLDRGIGDRPAILDDQPHHPAPLRQ
jgi:hypothetical protein